MHACSMLIARVAATFEDDNTVEVGVTASFGTVNRLLGPYHRRCYV
jgi:hypothetical protein